MIKHWEMEPHWQAEWQNMAYGNVLYATRLKLREWAFLHAPIDQNWYIDFGWHRKGPE
jgi:hypothetical protein